MAKKKNSWMTYIGILGVALVLLLISIMKNSKFEEKSENLLDLKTSDITTVTISSSKDTVSFTYLNDTTWAPVIPDTGIINVSKVDRFLSTLANLKKIGIATEKEDKFSTYNVDDKATLVSLKKGDVTLKSFFVGRSQSSWQHSYIRFKDEKKVYRVDENLSYQVNANPTNWLKR